MGRTLSPLTTEEYLALLDAHPTIRNTAKVRDAFARMSRSGRRRLIEEEPHPRGITNAIKWAKANPFLTDEEADGPEMEVLLFHRAAQETKKRHAAADRYREHGVDKELAARRAKEWRERKKAERAAKAAEQWAELENLRRTADVLEEDRGDE